MLHTPVPCYNTHASDLLKKEMQKEAATHFNVRHPAILAFYGILAKDECSLITEAGIGSLEQTFVRARHTFEHWSVRDYLLLAQQVLQGLTYLSTNLTHRDLACRSIIEVREKTLFKIGRFGLSQSIKGYSGDDNTKVAVRWAAPEAVSYTHLRAHETPEHLVCRLLLEKKKKNKCLIYLRSYPVKLSQCM
eukprot:TRINITY_DN20518_c0_g1_i2.p1 TRINITY_DN20518_c0_g1~~TRINITY_DN20518_c0_g1_i2.p1  ORF type:complete len:191 (+),score=40.81 TRINITY_DN20518_c0_g1_i2:183-755(+)